MTIHIKHRSGGSIVELAKLWHDSIADMYRAKYAAVPVTIKKHRLSRAVIHRVRCNMIEGAKYTLQDQRIKDMIYE